MRLGILADIHEHVGQLRAALSQFDRDRIDRVVILGDVYGGGERFRETVELLASCGASGVWGNHDFGYCQLAAQSPERLRTRFSDFEIGFLSSLVPRFAIEDCLFTHVEPWRDLEDASELWHLEGPPNTPRKVTRCFKAVTERRLFVGHFHQWQLATTDGLLQWAGERSVLLDPQEPHLVVVNAVCNRCFAVFDTKTGELTPFRCEATNP
jgi:hypothetical protein